MISERTVFDPLVREPWPSSGSKQLRHQLWRRLRLFTWHQQTPFRRRARAKTRFRTISLAEPQRNKKKGVRHKVFSGDSKYFLDFIKKPENQTSDGSISTIRISPNIRPMALGPGRQRPQSCGGIVGTGVFSTEIIAPMRSFYEDILGNIFFFLLR